MDYLKVDNWRKLPELKRLKDASPSPKELFYFGKWDKNIFKNCVAIVGSRRMTNYGKTVLQKMIPKLVFEGKTIISGFMYGVDQYTHQLCLDNGGKTIAVLGWGITYPLSSYDLKLAKEIISKGGLLLSEWENQKPLLWTFPVRNRIVAALSQEVIIIEAAHKSGSLITANLAVALKRRLWAVPGPITSTVSEGTNELIASGKAQAWLGKSPINKKTAVNKDPVLSLLQNEALTADEMARQLNVPVSQIGAQLSIFTLTGEVMEKGGKYYLNEE